MGNPSFNLRELAGALVIGLLAVRAAEGASAPGASLPLKSTWNVESPVSWSQYRGDAGHAGTWAGRLVPEYFATLWATGTNLNCGTQPAVSEDGTRAFALSRGPVSNDNVGEIVAFDMATGTSLWSVAVACDESRDSCASPVCRDGYVYWAGGAGSAVVCRIEAASGSTSNAQGGWRAEIGPAGILDASVVLSGPHVFVTTSGGEAGTGAVQVALRTADGGLKWSQPAGEPGRAAMAYDRTLRAVWQVIGEAGLYRLRALDAFTGSATKTAAWTLSEPPLTRAVVAAGSRLYLQTVTAGGSGTLYVAESASASRLATVALTASGPFSPAVDSWTNLYVAGNTGDTGRVSSFDAAGALRWSVAVPGRIAGGPVWADGKVVAGDSTSNRLHVLDAADGRELAQLPGCGPVAFGASRMLSIGSDGRLYAHSTGTHSIEATAGPGGSLHPRGRVEVAHGESITFRLGPEVADVRVDGVSTGAVTGLTLASVMADHRIDAVFRDPWADAVVYTNGLTQGPYLTSPANQWDDPQAVLGKVNNLDRDDNTGDGDTSPMCKLSMVQPLWWRGTTNAADEGLVVPGTNNGCGLMGTAAGVTVSFAAAVSNDARNPFGVDLIVFGNSFFYGSITYTNTDMNSHKLSSGDALREPLVVSVAQRAEGPWYTYTNACADDWFPLNPWPWDSESRAWGKTEQEYTRPVDPWLTNRTVWAGKTVSEAIAAYDGSAGGSGFDLAASGFEWIRYVRVSDGLGNAGEITALADVSAFTGQYWLDVTAEGSGVVDRASGWVDSGERVTVTASPLPGGVFRGWSGDLRDAASTNEPVLTLAMDRARGLTAHFGAPRFTVATAHGSPAPAAGTYTHAWGTDLTNRVGDSEARGTTQYVCRGWALAGGEPAGGPGTSVVVRLTNDTVLTWLWTTQHWVSIEATAGGRADAASGWREATGGLSVAAAADAYWHFDSWSGGVSEAEQRMNPLTLSADRPRSVTAVFAANLATNGIPEWWLAQHGQTAPGFDEAAGADPDEDGQDTWKEYYAGTDPTNGESLLRIVGLDAGEGSNRLVWTAGTNGSGLPFRVDVRAVSGTNWMTAVTNWPRSPTLTNACWVATNGSGGVCFRVRVQREP